jgi:hypothetical protein
VKLLQNNDGVSSATAAAVVATTIVVEQIPARPHRPSISLPFLLGAQLGRTSSESELDTELVVDVATVPPTLVVSDETLDEIEETTIRPLGRQKREGEIEIAD